MHRDPNQMPCSISDGPPDDFPISCKSNDCDEPVPDEDMHCPECVACWRESLEDR